MKKNLLALSIAAMVGGIAGGANAQVTSTTIGAAVTAATGGRVAAATVGFGKLAPVVAGTAANFLEVNEKGIGNILLVPYFTTQGQNASLLNIVNTDRDNGKAVKLRYRGAANSDDLFDITIYLSPEDVWTATVSQDESGVSKLVTTDGSCTLPSKADIAAVGGKFKTDRVRNNAVAETREGYIEILNMADIPRTGPGFTLFNAIKHVNGAAPCNAMPVNPAYQAVMDAQENELVAFDQNNDPQTRGYSWPTGGLFANWTIVNVADRASFSGEAVAIEARVAASGAKGAANLVWSPQTTAAVTQTQAALLTADPLLGSGVVRAASYDFPDLSTPYTSNGALSSAAGQANLLAFALQVNNVNNEYLTNKSVESARFATDWVFSMPTRRYAVAMDYLNVNKEAAPFVRTSNLILSNPNVVGHYLPGANGNVFLSKDKDRLCVSTLGLRAVDREENSKTTFVISPDSAVNLCGEVSVLTFNPENNYSVLGASLARVELKTDFADGWFTVGTPGVGRGLPVVGFAAVKAQGSNLGGTWAHRYNK